jgi:hypothetical protein
MKKFIIMGIGVVIAGIVVASNEVTTSVFLRVKNGNYDVQRSVANTLDDQTTSSADQGILTCPPTATAIPIVNVVTPKWTYLRMLGTNNYIDVTCTLRLYAGDTALLPLANTNIQATAAAGTTNKLEYWVNGL